jgi:hypothetical protein
MRRIAARLTYANVVATIALVIAVGGGVAYAANTVFSTDIVDGEVKTADIATNAVRSTKIAPKQIQSGDVRELDAFFGAAANTGICTADSGAPVECLQTTVDAERPGRLLVNMTSSWHTFSLAVPARPGDDPTLVRGRCWLTVDGTQIGDKQAAGERSNGLSNHPNTAPGSLAITALSGPIEAGSHNVGMVCAEEDGDLDWQNINLTAAFVAG